MRHLLSAGHQKLLKAMNADRANSHARAEEYQVESSNSGGRLQSEAESQAGINHTAFQQCPRVDGPGSVEMLLWPQ
jgi:hypothetical protein